MWQSGVSSEEKSKHHQATMGLCESIAAGGGPTAGGGAGTCSSCQHKHVGQKGRPDIRTSSRVFSAIILCIPIPTPSITANRMAHPIAEFLAALKPPRIANEPPVRNPAPTKTPSALNPSFTLLLFPALHWERIHTSIPGIFLLPKALDRTVKCRE